MTRKMLSESFFRTYEKSFNQVKPPSKSLCCEMGRWEVFSYCKLISQQNFLGPYIDLRLVHQHEAYA